ncbi:hypothetical protein CapIbe_013963 [Capra ibex]
MGESMGSNTKHKKCEVLTDVSAPRFDKIPWFSEASFMNKPLVLSLPKRYPHSSATFLVASKKDMNLPILFQVPDVLSKTGWNQNDPTLIRNKQLCSTCRDVKMVQPKTLIIPDDLKQSFANIMNHRMMSLHPPKAQTVPKRSCDDILTENVHYRLPILGPRTAVFHGLLSDAYETLRETELSSLPSKEPVSKAVNQLLSFLLCGCLLHTAPPPPPAGPAHKVSRSLSAGSCDWQESSPADLCL